MGVEQTGKTVILNHVSGSSAEIYLFGATVTSWKVGGKEKLYLSEKSCLDSTKPIRGGIPIVFPIFGPPPSSPPDYAAMKQHGYVRTVDWTLAKVIMDRDEGVSVRFLAPPPPAGFNHKFKLTYVVTLSAHELTTDIHIVNEGTEDFKFQALLHNYLAADANKLSITGIDQGVKYKDKVQNYKELQWPGGPLTIKGETDNVFAQLPSKELMLDYGDGSGVTVRFRGFEDTTIWNPREEKGRGIGDLEEGGWDKYVCIEPGYVREFKAIKPGEEFLGMQVLRAW